MTKVADQAEGEIGRLRALAHPLRLRMLSLLTASAMSAAEVGRELGITHANASYHLRLLADAGLIVVEGEEQIRGGLAKRYRHPIDRPTTPTPEELAVEVQSMSAELLRRFGRRHPDPPAVFTDAELWVSPEVWSEATELVKRASLLVHEHAQRPRTKGTVKTNLTVAAFRMGAVTRPDALAPLRVANFRWYFASRFVNMVGGTMASVALAFAVLEVSDSPRALGTVLAANSIPMVVFMLAGGVIADRFGRTLVIQCSNLVAGTCQLGMAALVLSGHAQIWQMACLAALIGTSTALSFPALASVMPQLVARDQLQQANVLISMMRGGLTILGPSVAALIVTTAGPAWALAVDGVTYLGAAALLLGVHIPARERTSDAPSAFAELRHGWSYFRNTTWLWVVVLAFTFINMIHAGALTTLGPVLAKQGDLGERGWGLILSAEAVGLLLTTLVMIRVPLRRPLLVGMLGMAAEGVLVTMLGLEPGLLVLLVFAVVAGIGIEMFSLGWNLAMQEHVPDHMLSRAYSYDALGSFVAIPIGTLIFGPLGAVFGVAQVILVGGLIYLTIALVTLTSRSVRTLDRVNTTSQPAPG